MRLLGLRSASVLCALVASVAVFLPASTVATFDPKRLLVVADVGSGGTRLYVYKREGDAGRAVSCCKKACSDANSRRTSKLNHRGGRRSRFTQASTVEQVEGFASTLFQDATEAIKTAKMCEALGKELEGLDDFGLARFLKTKVLLLATAGARMGAMENGQDFFAETMVEGFRSMFRNEIGLSPEQAQNLVQGQIMDGPMEAYFGVVAGYRRAEANDATFSSKAANAMYIEVGGASQQVAYYRKKEAVNEVAATDELRFRRKASLLRSSTAISRGPMDMSFPMSRVVGFDDGSVDSVGNPTDPSVRKIFGASTLGTGANRVFIHALRHAIQNPSFRINDNVVRCPCLPGDAYPVGGNWEEQDPSKYLTLQWDVTNPGRLKQLGGVQFGRGGDAAACLRRDAVTDNVIKGWLHADPSARKITGQKKDAGECLAFMKSMFENEKDEVDKKAVRQTFHSLNQKVHREMQEDNMQGAHLVVYNGPIANKVMEGFMDLENKWMTMANFEQFRTKWCSELAPNQMSTSKYNVQACVLATEATVLIEDYLGGGSLSDEKLNTVKVMPIDASWTRVAAEYAFSQLEWEVHHAPQKLKPWREFQTEDTHKSEDEFFADAETV